MTSRDLSITLIASGRFEYRCSACRFHRKFRTHQGAFTRAQEHMLRCHPVKAERPAEAPRLALAEPSLRGPLPFRQMLALLALGGVSLDGKRRR